MTLPKLSLLGAIVVYWTTLPVVLGFRFSFGTIIRQQRNTTLLHLSADNINTMELQNFTDEDIQQEKNAQLNFHGEFNHHHHIALPNTLGSTKRLYAFFQNRLHRNLLLKGGENPTEEISKTPELLAKWTSQARIVSSTPPTPLVAFNKDYEQENDHDSVVAIHSTVPVIPGLSIKAISYTGCRLLPHPQTMLPMYEFTLIQDRCQAEGTRALVWLYHKITGETPSMGGVTPNPHAASDSTTGTRDTCGLCRVALEQFSEEALRLSYYSMVRVSCTLPQRLLKLLPLSKQNIEAKVSASMVKQLETEVLQSADKFHSALEAWLQQPRYHSRKSILNGILRSPCNVAVQVQR